MSSIAKDEPENFDIKLSKLASGIFGSINTELYINMLPLQKDGISCRIIALKITRMFHSMLHGKYKDRHPDFDIFASLGVKEGKDSTIVVDGLTFHQVDKLPSKIMQLDQYLRTTTSTPYLPTSSDGTELGTTKHRFGAERPHKDQLKQLNIKFEHLIDKFKLNLNNFLSLFRNNRSSLNDLANKFSSGSLVRRSESDSDRESKSPGL